MPPVSDLKKYYDLMLERFGPRKWWPGDSASEVVLGVVLTQNCAWSNVEKALNNLKALGPLTPAALAAMPDEALAQAIRPSGYYNQKVKKIRNVLAWLRAKAGEDSPELMNDASLDFLRGENLYSLREELLGIRGIGPESADSILLYALEMSSFVIDAYTYRMLCRHGFAGEYSTYEDMQDMFVAALPEDLQIYNECHALIVRLGQEHCRKSKPLCESCPLIEYLDYPVLED